MSVTLRKIEREIADGTLTDLEDSLMEQMLRPEPQRAYVPDAYDVALRLIADHRERIGLRRGEA